MPVLGIAGWHDDARGTIRNYQAMRRLRGAPPYHVVMNAGAHKRIDYVNAYFGPQARIDRRALQLRWMDHYLKGIETASIASRRSTSSSSATTRGARRTSGRWREPRGPISTCDATGCSTRAPGDEPPDEYTYDPNNPTPFLVDARELELSLNEDYRAVDADRKDLVTYTTAPLSTAIEITGPVTATLWAVTDAKIATGT